VYLPWGNDAELAAAREISFDRKNAVVLSKLSLGEIAGLLSGAAGVVGVDTGLAHLAAALQIPSVTLYIETYPSLTGACGLNQTCISQKKIAGGETPTAGLATRYLDTITAEAVWGCLRERL
ncbi:MAG: glycosyltransferase family 9 protein, partial [Gammaproteobacteria bacterium]